MQRFIASILILAASLTFIGCGQTGGLYLPEPEPEEPKKTS